MATAVVSSAVFFAAPVVCARPVESDHLYSRLLEGGLPAVVADEIRRSPAWEPNASGWFRRWYPYDPTYMRADCIAALEREGYTSVRWEVTERQPGGGRLLYVYFHWGQKKRPQ